MIWSVVPASANASDARKFSSLPSPTTSGDPLRAPTNRCGSPLCITAIAYAPLNRETAARTAAKQIAAIQLMNQMRNDFGIGFRDELVAGAFQIRANRFVVFDDAVMYDCDFIARKMGMRIRGDRRAVGRPPRVRNTQVARQRRLLDLGLELGDARGAARPRQFAVLQQRYAA